MGRCARCSRDIPPEAHGGRCPYCGAVPSPVLGHARDEVSTVILPVARRVGIDDSGPDDQISRRTPLGDARFAPGHIFARRYRIVSLLGRGGMGEVYRSDDLRIGRPIALKLLAGPTVQQAQIHQFVAEVRLAREIAHPNVCRVHDIGHRDGWHYLSMEYVDGETLASLLRRVGRMPSEKATDIARQLCAGLAAAHEAGVLHRDIKPSNIMIDGRGHVRLMDFGLAIAAGEASVGEVAGTPAYMAPEQLAGKGITERTDLYALGLVLYEMFTGRQMFPVRSFDERHHFSVDAATDSPPPQLDPVIASIVGACLMRDPAARPSSARALGRLLPGGDPLAAAVAEGRLLSPDMVAAAGERGEMRPAYAWTLCAALAAAVLFIAARTADITQLSPSVLPKSPDALTERAHDILKVAGHDAIRRDSEHWFVAELESQSAPAANARLRRVRFAFRQSPAYLLPQNLFRLVTTDDPAPTLPGMAWLDLDADGRLIELSIVPVGKGAPATTQPAWDALFAAAGLHQNEFLAVAVENTPAVPHDRALAWNMRSGSSAPIHVSAASLQGRPVYFGVTSGDASLVRSLPRNALSPGAPPLVEATLWLAIVLAFIVAAVMARHNYRRGEGDRVGARRWNTVLIICGTASGILQGHHVPNGIQEASFLFAVTGWALVFGALSWLLHISLEPHVRRLWPATLISWTRLLSGRVRDPMVGRDVLIGLTGGVVIISARLLLNEPGPNDMLIQQLDALRSTRVFAHGLLFNVMNAVQYTLGALFFLLLIRVIVRRTWIAAIVTVLFFLPITSGGTAFQSWTLGTYSLVMTFLLLALLMQVGFVAASAAMLCLFVLTRQPLTIDTSSWYFGYSIVTMLVVVLIAIIGASVASVSAIAPAARDPHAASGVPTA